MEATSASRRSGGAASLSPLASLLRCLDCGQPLESGPSLRCAGCGAEYPVLAGTARMLRPGRRKALAVREQTAASFAYEWRRFGALRDEWRKNFLDYMQPHRPEWFQGKRVLDVGAGSGRHSHWAARFGASVVSVDLGESIDVARANLPPEVLTVQADAEELPFDEGTFDLVMSIGVLHHLPDTEGALRAIARYARPGGEVRAYLYWQPPLRWHRSLLRLVSPARVLTVRLPHPVLHALCYPIAAGLFVSFVAPYKLLRHAGPLRGLAARLPLKTYADYPFAVLVNDQFDRFSAPIERRYEREEVARLMRSAGLEDVSVLPNSGWLGIGRRPSTP